MSREALKRYTDYRIPGGDTFVEKGTWTIRALHQHCQYIKDKAWSYHASCTAAISADSDSNAVLDSNIKVAVNRTFMWSMRAFSHESLESSFKPLFS
jgi:choline dehydrogenase